MSCYRSIFAVLLLSAFSADALAGAPHCTCAAETLPAEATCDFTCNSCSSCDRCFLGSCIARLDAAYENALAQRRCRRPSCNRTVMERMGYSSNDWNCACDGAPNSPLSYRGYAPERYAAAHYVPERYAPERYATAPAPVAERGVRPQFVASRAPSKPAAPSSVDVAPEPTDEAPPAPTAEAPSEPTEAEPVKLLSPQGESGAQWRALPAPRVADSHVERVAYEAATDEMANQRLAVQASFSDDYAPAAPVVSRGAKCVNTRSAAFEIRFKSELENELISTGNPLR